MPKLKSIVWPPSTMKSSFRLLLLLMIAGLVYPLSVSPYCATAAQEANQFVGSWQPVAEEGVTTRLESLQINADNTFLMKAKGDSGRDLKGTYTVKDGKLQLQAEEFTKHHDEPVGTIGDDGRLKLVMNSEDKGHYLVKK